MKLGWLQVGRGEGIGPRGGGRAGAAGPPPADERSRPDLRNAWEEARELVWAHRGRLALGLALMLVNRLAGLVLPATAKYLIDEVVARHRGELLVPLAIAAGGATLVEAGTSFALSQVLGVAAQRAITDMRRSVQAHVTRLPVGYFDSTQTGVLISRIMYRRRGDPEPGRDRARAAERGTGHRRAGAGGALLPQLAADLDQHRRAGGVRRRDGVRLYPAAPAVPRAQPDQCRGDRAAGRVAGRHPRRQGVHRREA